MSTIKMIGTAAIMVACFAIIYPRFMHPIVLRVFGMNEPSKNSRGGNDHMHPPGMKGRSHPGSRRDEMMAEEMRRNMRHTPHPGMRHAAEMNSRQQSQGSSKGMMGIVLPMYAIGIVLYLVYTLYKVFNKTNNKNKNMPNYYSKQKEASRDKMGFPSDFDNSGPNDVRNYLNDQQNRKDLENLLSRADEKNVSVDEMRLLQQRLEETEAQMTKILAAMQTVQTSATNVASAATASPATPPSTPVNEAASPEEEDKSNGLSPDTTSSKTAGKGADDDKVNDKDDKTEEQEADEDTAEKGQTNEDKEMEMDSLGESEGDEDNENKDEENGEQDVSEDTIPDVKEEIKTVRRRARKAED